MSERLKNYLEEIGHYLGISREKQEILTEIKSHILEKAEQEFGNVTDDAVERIIDTYGNPRRVAEKYMDDSQIIAPAFKGYLLRYTMILFAFHFVLILLSAIFRVSMVVIPFFYIPKMDSFQAFFYLPMAFVFDLGLVGIILYFVTQSRKEINLPWPKLKVNWQKIMEGKQTKSKLIPLILMLMGYTALVWIYWRSGTLFFKTINLQDPRSLLTPLASQWYSLGLLALLGIGIAAYVVKFFTASEWVDLLRSAGQLVILGILFNRPMDDPFSEFVYIDLQIIANIFIAIIAAVLAIDFLKSLIILMKNSLMKKTSMEP
jgi:hypothetical protein